MPLTVAHPAIVIPLRKTRLPFSALVVGSVAPDLEYLFHLSPTGHIGHTVPGLFVFCIPMGLVSLIVVHWLWMPPANALLDRTSDEFRLLPLAQLGLICGAILLGAFSHLAWDSFTHAHGWMVQRLSVLRVPLAMTPWGTMRLFKLLQHLSSALGIAVLGVFMNPRLRTLPSATWSLIAVLIAISGVGGAFIGILKAGVPADFDSVREYTGIAIVGSFAVFAAVATIASSIWRVRRPGN
jgi:hypothetical protein